MDSSSALLWTTFLKECQLLTEKETKQPHQWDNIYPTNKQREDILDGLFMKNASIGAIILRNRTKK
jgi:hypothetical protein